MIAIFSLCGCGESKKEEVEIVQSSVIETEVSDDHIEGSQKAEELINEMESIDWEQNYDDAKEKGKEAAEFLNELLK